jgi:plastocyanin
MRLRSQFLATAALMSLVLGFVPSAFVRAETPVPTLYDSGISAGDLIRGTSFSAVYYMGEDGFRYVFPNDKTYFTWYENFDDVEMITDAELSAIQMGGNVTYHPGLKMIKINSDPKTYMVAHGGTLRWVSTEAIAIELYGAAWNTKIDDVADAFFTNYEIGDAITDLDAEASGDLLASHEYGATSSISDDKELTDYTWIPIEDMEFQSLESSESVTTISVGQTVKWTNNDSVNHTATADDNSWGTGTIKPGGEFVRRFDEPGTYTYFCSYHPEMTGTIIVEDGD